MDSIGKSFASILILIMAISSVSILMVKPANAQSATPNTSPIPTPSAPTFTLKFTDNSYNVPTTTTSTTDPYTGKQIVTVNEGYYVQNDSIVLSIVNQPFTSYVGPNYNVVNLYDAVRFKGHYSNTWNNVSFSQTSYYQASGQNQAGGDNVELVFGVGGNNGSEPFSGLGGVGELGGQVDFQVQAFIGYETAVQGTPDPLFHQPTYQFIFNGQSSDWSNIQTITIPASSTSSSTSPTPTVPEFSILTILLVFIALSLFSLVVLAKKHLGKIAKL